MKPSDYFRIGPRLTFAFALLIALILCGNALVIWQFQMAAIQTNRLTSANQQLIAILQLQVDLLSFHQRLVNLARSGDARDLTAQAEPLRRVLQEQAEQTRKAVANQPPGTQIDPSFSPTLETIEVSLPGQLDAINGLAKSGDWETVQHRLDNELGPIETRTSALVDSFQKQANDENAQAVLKMRSVQRRILIIVPITAITTFFIATLFGWQVTRRIVDLRLEERVNERTRIARELHDSLLQGLHGLMFKFQAARNMLPSRPQDAMQTLDKAISETEHAIVESRDAIHNLRSQPVSEEDLAALLEGAGEELAALQDAHRISPSFRVIAEGESQKLSPDLQDEVYRIAREVLRNAFQHAGAGQIEVEIRYDENQLRVRIRDDGKGIDPEVLEESRRPGHWGLAGMRERAERIGSQLKFWSQASAGTEIELTVPAAIAYERTRNDRRFRFFRKEGKL